MNKPNPMSLATLLPAVYSLRDAEMKGPLAAILSVLEEQVGVVSDNIDQLYDDLFIETCQPWLAPYLGEVVDVKPFERPAISARERQRRGTSFLSPRREVADAIRLERRKGTLAVLEDLAAAVAAWPARAVEYYAQVHTFQSSQHLDPGLGRTVDSRDLSAIAKVGTPFNTQAHFIDSRTLELPPPRAFENKALFHTRHVGMLIWRLGVRPVSQAPARWICSCTNANRQDRQLRVYAVDSFGLPLALAINPVAEADELGTAEEQHVPGPLTLTSLTHTSTAGVQTNEAYYGPDKSLQIWTQIGSQKPERVPALWVVPHDLSWTRDCRRSGRKQRTSELIKVLETKPAGAPPDLLRIAVDPEHGLLAMFGTVDQLQQFQLRTTFHFNFSAEMGSGEYDRPRPLQRYGPNKRLVRIRGRRNWQKLLKDLPPEIGKFTEPNDHFEVAPADPTNVGSLSLRSIEIADSATYLLNASQITIPAGVQLEIRAAPRCRPTLELMPPAHCKPALTIKLGDRSRLQWEGLRIAGGRISIVKDEVAPAVQPAKQPGCGKPVATPSASDPPPPPRVDIQHCTLLPEHRSKLYGIHAAVSLEFSVSGGRLAIGHSIVGSLRVPRKTGHAVARVSIADSIVDAQRVWGRRAIAGEMLLRVERSTILGRTRVREIDLAADSIFTETVRVARRQVGGMRFCFVPAEPHFLNKNPYWFTPQQYYCQPSQSFERQGSADCGAVPPDDSARDDVALRWAQIRDQIEAKFISTQFGSSAYCQLALDCPAVIAEGAEDGAEMGAFHDLFQPQRAAALQRRLEQFTPLSMQSALIYVT